MIRYAAVCHPEHCRCVAVFDCRAFGGGVRQRQRWFLTIDARHASWERAGSQRSERFEFSFD